MQEREVGGVTEDNERLQEKVNNVLEIQNQTQLYKITMVTGDKV